MFSPRLNVPIKLIPDEREKVAVSTSRKYPNDVMLNVMYNYM